MVTCRVRQGGFTVVMLAMAVFGFAGIAQAGKAELKGNFQVLSDEKSTHKPG